MPAPTGSESQLGYKYATRLSSYGEDVGNAPVNNFIRFKSLSGMIPKRTFAATENMDPSNQSLKGQNVAAPINMKVSWQPDVNSLMRLIAHFCRKDPAITTPAGGTSSRQWVNVPFERGDSANAAYIDSLLLEPYDGQDCPLIYGARVVGMGFKIAAGKLIDSDLDIMACQDTYTSNATQIAINTYSGKPIIRGHWAQALVASTLKVKVTAAAGGGFDGTVKWTTATYAGSTTIQIKFDTWYRIVLDDASRLGVSYTDDVWFCFPSSGGTTLAAGATPDEWSFTATRTPASASYSTRDVLQAAGLEFSVGGAVYYVQSADVKLMNPGKPFMPAGTKYALTIQKGGRFKVSITLDRDREDRDFIKKLISAEAFAVAVKLYGNNIEANIDEKFQIDIAAAQAADVNRDVTTELTLGEKVEVIGHRSGSTDIVSFTTIGTLTAL